MHYVCPQCSAEIDVAPFRLRPLRCRECGFCREADAFRKFYGKVARRILKAYPFAWGIAVFVLVTVSIWMVTDAQFRRTLMWTRIDLGVPDDGLGKVLATFSAELTEKYRQWEALGLRILMMKGLFILFVASLFIIVLRPFARKPTLWTFIGDVTPIVGMFALIATSDGLVWWSIKSRVRSQLPRFHVAVEPLLQNWPTDSGTLPEAGPYLADHERLPNQLYLTKTDDYSRIETFGMFVERSPTGAVLFSLAPHYDHLIEYHPVDSAPSSQTDKWGHESELEMSVRLEDRWYLTKYRY